MPSKVSNFSIGQTVIAKDDILLDFGIAKGTVLKVASVIHWGENINPSLTFTEYPKRDHYPATHFELYEESEKEPVITQNIPRLSQVE